MRVADVPPFDNTKPEIARAVRRKPPGPTSAMPTYDYKCQQCEHRFEHFQSMTDDPLTTCPVCGGSVKRLVGAGAGIIFKGSGFYCTDYKNTGNGGGSSEKKTEGADGSADTEPPKKTTAAESATTAKSESES